MVFENLGRLQSLELWGNDLSSLPENLFQGLASLKLLYLRYNRLTSLPKGIFRGLHQLSVLLLDVNQLTSLPKGRGLQRLRYLGLKHNRLAELPEGIFEGLQNLEILSCVLVVFWDFLFLDSDYRFYHNKMKSPAFSRGYRSWPRILDQRCNELADLPETVFHGLDVLGMLLLDGNNLRTLHEATLQGLDKVFLLRLAWNRLRTLPPNLFANFSSRVELQLELDQNNLSELPEGLFDGLELRGLMLAGNRRWTECL